MPKFTNPSADKLPALVEISQSFKRGVDLDFSLNQQIADLLGVPVQHYTTSFDYALRLRDIVYAGYDYLNIDMREYNVGTKKEYFLIKLQSEYGESEGDHHTRAGALLDAVIGHIVFEMEDAAYEAKYPNGIYGNR